MLAPLSDAHRAAIGLAVGAPGSVDAATLANAALPVSTAADPDSFLVTLDRSIAPATYPALAARTCGARPSCKFMAWTDASATPAKPPPTPQQVALVGQDDHR